MSRATKAKPRENRKEVVLTVESRDALDTVRAFLCDLTGTHASEAAAVRYALTRVAREVSRASVAGASR